jgi:hypothetical protein
MQIFTKIKFIFIFFLVTLNLFSEPRKFTQLDAYLDNIKQFNWDKVEKNPEITVNGYKMIGELNLIFTAINSNQSDFKTNKVLSFTNDNKISKLQLISSGIIKIDDDKELFIDFEELTENRFRYIAFVDNTKKLSMVLKNTSMLYFIDFSITPAKNYKVLLNSLYFSYEDFYFGSYSLTELLRAINNIHLAAPIVPKNEVLSLYGIDATWKRYFLNEDGSRLMFKPDIGYDLNNETINPLGMFTGKDAFPSKLLPIYTHYNRDFKAPKDSYLFLNELISIPNFYDVWYDRLNNWVFQIRKPELSQLAKQLTEETKQAREKSLSYSDTAVKYNLSVNSTIKLDSTSDTDKISQKDKVNIVSLNRLLLEETFPQYCPKKLELKMINEETVGDINDYIDSPAIKILMKKNLTNKVIYEKNRETEEIIDDSKTKDIEVQRFYENKAIKNKVLKSNLFIISTRCNPKTRLDPKKYQMIEQTIFSDNTNTEMEFGDYYGKDIKIKSSLKLKYYYQSLKKYFEENKKDEFFTIIYDKEINKLYDFLNYFSGKFLINNKYYKISDYKILAFVTLKLQYEYINNEIVKNPSFIENENWELPIPFVNLGDNIFTNYFLDYEK